MVRIGLTLLAAMLALGSGAASAQTAAQCCDAQAADWPKVGGNYGSHNYSSLDQINRRTVGRLGGAWRLNLENGAKNSFQQSNAVAVGGVVFVETTQGSVVAVDGRSGEVKWRYRSPYGGTLRRGVAVGEGKVFTTTAGNHALALDQNTGEVVWDQDLSDDEALGSMPTAVTYHDGMIYFGTANSSRGAAIALKAADGALAWKVYGAPAPGEFGNDTWAGDSWRQAGAAPWLHPSIDPKLGLIYYTFGNARAGGPLEGSTREGQNLFANSIVALDLKTGKRAWHFQAIHHDIWDMDNVMTPVLVDIKVGGRPRQAVVYGSKSGMLFVLDRKTGEAVWPIEERPVPQEPLQKTWPTQPFTTNEPIVDPCPSATGPARTPPNYRTGCLYTPHLDDPIVRLPGTGGGADTSQFSYSHKTKLLYVGVGLVGVAQARNISSIGFRPMGEERSGKIVAYDLEKGRVAWQRDNVWSLAHGNGVLSTAGDLLFIGQPDGYLLALDAADGKELWRFQTGAGVHTQPIAYAVDGVQYVAVMAGGNFIPYDSPRGDFLWAFRLDGKEPPAAAPPPPPHRQPIRATSVAGAAANFTVHLGRVWSKDAVGEEESTSPNAMAPQVMDVAVGDTVTFLNPAGNAQAHCATQFFEGLFDTGKLAPGASFKHRFDKPGEYFFNDCANPATTGKIVVR